LYVTAGLFVKEDSSIVKSVLLKPERGSSHLLAEQTFDVAIIIRFTASEE
jgi:hypothetical protein